MSRWISVDKKLPEEEQKVLFTNIEIKHPYTGKTVEPLVSFGFYQKGYFYSYIDVRDKITATHWMKTPKPPKIYIYMKKHFINIEGQRINFKKVNYYTSTKKTFEDTKKTSYLLEIFFNDYSRRISFDSEYDFNQIIAKLDSMFLLE